MADEAYTAPRQDLALALKTRNISPQRFKLPGVGEWFEVPALPP